MASATQGAAGRAPLSSTASRRSRAWIASQIVLPMMLFVLSLAINLAHVDVTQFHPDETRWINRAHYASDLLNPFGPTWDDQYLTRGQPPLGSYLMGFGLLIQGRDTNTNGVWDFAYGADWNRSVGAMAADADLDAARRANAVVGAITVVLVYFVGQALMGRVAGVASGIILALHPLHIWISSQALSDQLFVLLVAAGLLVAIRLGRQPSRGAALGLGILLGLGGATKLSPLLLAFPMAVYGLVLIALARGAYLHRPAAERLGKYLLWLPVTSFATFVIVYPYLWPAPIRRTWNLFALRTQEMEGQSAAWPDVAVDNPVMALVRIIDRLTVQFSTTGDLLGGVAGLFGFDIDPWGIDVLLALIGIGVLTSLCIKRGLTSGTTLAALLLAGQVAAIVFGMKVDFYRYHLPVVLAVCVLTGLTVNLAWDQLTMRGAWRILNSIPGVSIAEPPTAGRPANEVPAPSNRHNPLQPGSNQ